MKFLIWDSETPELESLLDASESFANLDIFEDVDDLIDEVIDTDVVVFDLDTQLKGAEKAVKKIKKQKINCTIIFLANSFDDKKIAKHQKSKVGGNLYVKTPIEDTILVNMLQPFVEEEIQLGISKEDQTSLLSGHTKATELNEEVQELSQKFDQIFSEVYGEDQAQQMIDNVQSQQTQSEIDISNDAPLDVGIEEDNSALDIGVDDEPSQNVSGDDIEEEILTPDEDDLEYPDMDDLAYPDMGDTSSNEELLVTENENIELNSESEDDLGDGLELSDTEEPMMADNIDDLSLDDDVLESSADSGVEELELGESDIGDIDLSEDGPVESTLDPEEDALDLSMDEGADIDLGAGDEPQSIADPEENALDLGTDDLGGDDLSLGVDDEQVSVDLSEADALDLSDDIPEIEEATDITEPSLEENDELTLGGDDLGDELSLGGDDASEIGGEELSLGGDDASEIGGEELSLGEDDANDIDENSSDEALGLEFGSDDENDLSDLDFGGVESDNSVTDDLPSDEPMEEMSLDDDLGDDDLDDSILNDMEDDEISDEALFGADELSSDQLPTTPELDSDDLSTNAKVQLAQIDEMMGDGPEVQDDIEPTIQEMSGQQFEQTQKTDGLAKELNALNPEFDATSDDKTEILEDVPTSKKPTEAPYKDTLPTPRTSESQIQEHREVMASSSEELVRLGETIKNLREDREKLLEKIYTFEEDKNNEKQDYINLQAELDERKIELSLARKRYDKYIDDLKYQLDISNQKKAMLDEKNKQLEREVERLSKKTNLDVSRIRARETELENKLDLLRADSETQIKNRDQKILELKRRIDTLEFDVESMHMKERKVSDSNVELEDKMERVIRTLRHAIGDLEENDNSISHLERVKKNLDI